MRLFWGKVLSTLGLTQLSRVQAMQEGLNLLLDENESLKKKITGLGHSLDRANDRIRELEGS